MFDEKFLFNLFTGIGAFLASWFVKSLLTKDDDLRNEIKEIRKELKSEYLSKELAHQIHDGFSERLEMIYKTVEKINQKLDLRNEK